MSRTVPGKWILENILRLGRFYDNKWTTLQSRGAKENDRAFFEWLGRRRPDRPFFAFLNYFDAHEPYIPPPGYEGRFGIQPRTWQDYQFLVDFVGLDKRQVPVRGVLFGTRLLRRLHHVS